MSRIVDALIRFFLRWTPDSFVVAGMLSLLTFGLAVGVAGYGIGATIESWGDRFWDLLAFTNQITLTLLLGYALANTVPVRSGLVRLAGQIRTARAAYATACLVTGLASSLSWGLGLIVAGIASRTIGETCRLRRVPVHYPLLVASSYSGFVIWHQGLSSSIGLTLATPGHFLEDVVGLVPLSDTILNVWNIGVILITLTVLPMVMTSLAPKRPEEIEEMPDRLMRAARTATAGVGATDASPTPAERMERSPLLMAAIALVGLGFLYVHFIARGGGLTLDIFNFAFLIAGIMLAGSLGAYVRILVEGGRIAALFLLQYPFYAGISGVMADSGLAGMVVDVFARISTEGTLPFFSFLSAGLLNVFVPSGGGQWAVQGPIVTVAALELGADVGRTAMAVALGDQWTNLVQPLALVPVLAIAEVPLGKMLGYCFVALLASGIVFAAALLLF